MSTVTQAKDLPDEVVLEAVDTATALRAGFGMATRWDIAIVLQGRPELVGTSELFDELDPDLERIVRSKLDKMVRRGRVDGCGCGCRGDFARIPGSGAWR